MCDDDLEWERDGPRWLDKKICSKCNGEGCLKTRGDKTCPVCNGDGFVDDKEEGVILCPECHGARKIKIEEERGCVECSGRGYQPKIMQRFSATIKCAKCEGDGRSKEEVGTDEFEQCSSCEGTGKKSDKEYCSLLEWKFSPFHPKATTSAAWLGDGEIIEVQSDLGTYIEIGDCPECEDAVNAECPVCRGIRRVVVISQPCSECDGRGCIEIMETERCPECQGTGEAFLYEDREV